MPILDMDSLLNKQRHQSVYDGIYAIEQVRTR